MDYNIYTKPQSTYLKSNPGWHEEDSPWKAQQIIKIIERNKIKFQTMADIGCGAGEILRQLRVRYPGEGYSFYGYEISQDAFSMAESKATEGLHFYNDDIELKDSAHFDILLMKLIPVLLASRLMF